MVLVGILKDSGVFGYLAIKSAQETEVRPDLPGGITTVLSDFLDIPLFQLWNGAPAKRPA
jgi:hypothetical protein